MHHSTTLSLIIDIPHIHGEIASSLSQSDLARCVLVSSGWNTAFTPQLWRNILLKHPRTVSLFQHSSEVRHGLQRAADYVRSIDTFFIQSFPVNSAFRCLTRLKVIASDFRYKGIVNHTNTRRLLQFIKANVSLREITLSEFPLISVQTSDLLGDTIANHPGLVSVAITCNKAADLLSILHVLRGTTLSRVEKLSLVCGSIIIWSDDLLGVLIDSNTPGSAPYDLLPQGLNTTRLKDLTLDANLGQILHITLLPLLRHSPDLERLFVPCIDVRSFGDLCPILRRCCPKVQHLQGGFFHAKDEHQAMLLNAFQSLRTYIMGGSQPMGLQSIEALLHPQHRMTLEHLDIQCCIEIESKYIQLILTSCPSLRSFKSLSTKIGYVLYEPRLDIKDLPIRSGGGDPAWVCKGLRDLRIGFTGFSTLIEGESVNPYVDHIYGQLAVLTDLRILHLAGETSPRRIPRTSQVWAFDFTLESGLGKLKTLTKLKELNIQKLMHHRIAKAEIEWMGHHWPSWTFFFGLFDTSLTWHGGRRPTNSCSNSRDGSGKVGVNYIGEICRLRPNVVMDIIGVDIGM